MLTSAPSSNICILTALFRTIIRVSKSKLLPYVATESSGIESRNSEIELFQEAPRFPLVLLLLIASR